MRKLSGLAGFVAVVTLAGLATSANAATFIDADATANITQSGDTLTVALTETLANPIENNQLSGVDLVFSSDPASATLATSAGQLIDINGDGTFSKVSGNPDHWGVGVSGDNLYLETVGSYSTGGKPRNLIVDDGGSYTNDNSSFTQHQPQIMGTGTFTITLPNGFNALSDLTGVEFQYSTTAGFGSLVTSGVPEPATWVMLLTGFFGAGWMLRRARKHSPATITA